MHRALATLLLLAHAAAWLAVPACPMELGASSGHSAGPEAERHAAVAEGRGSASSRDRDALPPSSPGPGSHRSHRSHGDAPPATHHAPDREHDAGEHSGERQGSGEHHGGERCFMPMGCGAAGLAGAGFAAPWVPRPSLRAPAPPPTPPGHPAPSLESPPPRLG